VPVMYEPRDTCLIDQDLRRHPSQFEQVDLLPIQYQDTVFRVGQPAEGQFVLREVVRELRCTLRSDDEDDGTMPRELLVVLTQLREMRTAERSHEAAIEYQEDVPVAPKS